MKVCLAMSINKSQGQTFKTIGVDLTSECFSHGMFYVCTSRTGTSEKLYILAPNKRSRNVVYHEALQLNIYRILAKTPALCAGIFASIYIYI